MRDHAGPAPGRPRWLPAWLRTYRKADLGPDVVAGMTTGAVVIPKALAYATIAQLPVQAGLYMACVPMAVYAIVGASRRLSFSTTATLAILVGGALARVNPSGDATCARCSISNTPRCACWSTAKRGCAAKGASCGWWA